MDSVILDPVPMVKPRLAEDCKASFASNHSVKRTPGWYFFYDKSTVHIYTNTINTIRTTDFSQRDTEIVFVTHFEVEDVDYLLLQTTETLWIVDPITMSVEILSDDFDGCSVLQVSKGSNATKSSYFAAGYGQSVIVGIVSRQGTGFQVSKLSFELNSVNNPKITAISIYTEPKIDYAICYIGTDRGMVEIWKVANDASYMSKISTKGPVSHLSSDSSSPFIPNHKSLFVCHGDGVDNQRIPLIELYNIGERYTMISLQENLRWEMDYDRGKLLTFAFTKNESDYHVYTAYEQFESGNSDHVMLLDIYSVKGGTRVQRESFSVSEYGLIRDICPTPYSRHLQILFGSRTGKYLCPDDIPIESLEIRGPVLPSFDQWFGVDSKLFPFTQVKITQIKKMRDSLGGSLLVDKLFQLFAPLTAAYPPSNPNELRMLVSSIYEKENQSAIMKHCLVLFFNQVYYLLRFYSDERASFFIKEYGLARPFVYAVDGFWGLDNGDFTEAVRCLSDPSVNLEDAPDAKFEWNEKILDALLQFEKYQEALFFVQTTRLSCWTERIITLVLKVYFQSNVLDAITFQRKFAGSSAVTNLNLIFDHVFLPKPKTRDVQLLLGASLLPFEEDCLVEYCEKSKNRFCVEFLIAYFIQQGRLPEALRVNDQIGSDTNHSARQQLLLDVLHKLPPTIRKLFRSPVVSENSSKPSQKKESTLSQSAHIRGRNPTEDELLIALKENYVEQVVPEPLVLSTTAMQEEATEMDVTFDTEVDSLNGASNSPKRSTPLTTPAKVQETNAQTVQQTPAPVETPVQQPVEFQVPKSASVSKSPASPFMQPPFTPQKQTASPFSNADRKTSSELKSFKSPSKQKSQSPLVQVPKSPIPTTEQKSPYSNAPPLINRSPFAPKPPLSQTSVMLPTGLGLSDVQPKTILSPPRITRSSSVQTQEDLSTSADPETSTRTTRSRKKKDSPAKPILRSTRRRQASPETIQDEKPSRVTPARKAKQKLEISELPSTISKKSTKKKEERQVETPLRTIVTRRMARAHQ